MSIQNSLNCLVLEKVKYKINPKPAPPTYKIPLSEGHMARLLKLRRFFDKLCRFVDIICTTMSMSNFIQLYACVKNILMLHKLYAESHNECHKMS